MYRLYEKVPKSTENEHGLKLLDSNENPFKSSPCLLSMIALTLWERDVNGALNQGMEALRLKTSHNENSGLGLDDFGGRILSIAYSEPSETNTTKKGRKMSKNIGSEKELDFEFTRVYLFPLIEEDNHKIDVIDAMRNMRNVNILTYCAATSSALRMEECLNEHMQELGYTDQEIRQILSQLCLICFATDVKLRTEYVSKKEIKSTCISLGDVNDGEVGVSTHIIDQVKGEGTLYYKQGYYFHYGNGEHSLKNYITQNDALSTGIANTVTKALTNSITNNEFDEFIPLTRELIIEDLENIIEGLQSGKNKDELMSLVDEKINYGKNLNINEGEYNNPSSPKF